jgi:hypothetical protein
MAQAPVPEGLSSIPDHAERSAPQGAAKAVSAHLTEAGSLTPDQERATFPGAPSFPARPGC